MKRYKRRPWRIIKSILFQVLLLFMLIVCCKSLYDMFCSDGGNGSSSLSAVPSKEGDKPNGTSTSGLTDTAAEDGQPEGTDAIESNGNSLINAKNLNLTSRNAVLVRLADQQILYEKDSSDVIYPASLTKIMTAVIAIENLPDLKQSVQLPSELFQSLYDEDASLAGFLPGETVSALDLLYGILLPSGAECCVGLSDYIAGSEEAFARLMNEKAESLDMLNTHFTNSTGLNDTYHYTTVEDLAKLLEYALKNDTFREIFTSDRYSTGSTTLHPEGITFYSTMFENLTTPEFKGGEILGGKTGYTSEAGLCLASLARVGDNEYILVTAGAKGNHDTEQYNITDALSVYKSIY